MPHNLDSHPAFDTGLKLVVPAFDDNGGVENTSVDFQEQEKPLVLSETAPRIRKFQEEDLEEMVELDIKSFKKVYRAQGKEGEALREELRRKFKKRIGIVGPEWTQILEDKKSGKILGFLMSCPTSNEPKDFVSWEDSTDNGTLEKTYDPKGKNLYVITLTMEKGLLSSNLENMLYSNLMGKGIGEGYKQAFFETRLPGLKYWVEKKCKEKELDFDSLTKQQKDQFAEEYIKLTKARGGKRVPYDPLLRTFNSFGCKFAKLVPEAYQDEPSMNYGVLTVYENPFTGKVKSTRPIRKTIGKAMILASNSIALTRHIFDGKEGGEEAVLQQAADDEPTPEDLEKQSLWDKSKTKLLLGATAVSLAYTLAANPLGETKDSLVEVAPYVAGGLAAGEVLWIGGAALMLAAVGEKLKNPFKIRSKIPEIATKANDSKMFKTGFYTNTTGAVGQFSVVSIGIVDKLPPHTWGVLGIALLDLSITIALRRAIYKGVKNNASGATDKTNEAS